MIAIAHWALQGIFLLTSVVARNGTFFDPCHSGIKANIHGNEVHSNLNETRKSLSDLIKFSVDYKVDPCENFYEFACGNWIRNAPYELRAWGVYMKLTALEKRYEEEMREALRSVENSPSKAITQAATLYDKCMAAEEEWKQNGVSMIHFLWKKIKEYGDFPMLSEERMSEAEISKKFDFTWLLAYFNSNKTILHSIVPRVAYDESLFTAFLSFYPRNNIFSFLRGGIRSVKLRFQEFILDLMKTVADDVGVDYGKTIAPKDIVDMVDFMEALYAIEVPNLDSLLKNQNFIKLDNIFRLLEVDYKTLHVNWTEYLLLVAPVEVHHYVVSNPEVVADTDYVKSIDMVLQSATPRILTNFVITHYIFSWLTVLEAKYRKLIHSFATNVGSTIPQKRSEACFDLISGSYRHALLAIYARSKKYGNGAKPIIEEMKRGIIASFKDQLNENEWMGDEFRKGVFKKLDYMKSTLLHDEISANDTALDNLYFEHLKIKDKELPFLTMLDEVMYAEKKMLYYKLGQSFDAKKTFSTVAAHFDNPINAFYIPGCNALVVPLGIVQYPLFDPAFPMAYNYGSLGFIVAHEISHGFDNGGIHYDYTGEEKKWYREEWIREFDEKIECYIEQYNNKTIPIFDIPLNGTLTLSDNVADNEGMKIAYMAFKNHQKKYGEEARTDFVEDFTNDQLFFLSTAMTFCTKTSDLTLYYEQFSNHASNVYRVNNVALNTPAFASSFFCPPGSKMNPRDRCSVW